MGFSRQEYWSGLPCPSPGDLPNPGILPRSSALQADSLPSESPRKTSALRWLGCCWDCILGWYTRLNPGPCENFEDFGGWLQRSTRLATLKQTRYVSSLAYGNCHLPIPPASLALLALSVWGPVSDFTQEALSFQTNRLEVMCILHLSFFRILAFSFFCVCRKMGMKQYNIFKLSFLLISRCFDRTDSRFPKSMQDREHWLNFLDVDEKIVTGGMCVQTAKLAFAVILSCFSPDPPWTGTEGNEMNSSGIRSKMWIWCLKRIKFVMNLIQLICKKHVLWFLGTWWWTWVDARVPLLREVNS